ncbi:MAG: GNAT family N-acetyltransferase [Candidatus Obscuribacterales bacterium]|nr:GNAT family N-acetyltransferase [Candidatus Obscuribacterales bacterium]
MSGAANAKGDENTKKNADEKLDVKAEILIRKAGLLDAKAILNVHYAAVHDSKPGSASSFYDRETLDCWSPVVDEERVGNFISCFKPDDELMCVAQLGDKLIGFASIVPRLNELRSCYVDPSLSLKGVARSLLLHLEAEARQLRLGFLTLDASLNAESFYQKLGYQSDGLTRHPLPGGLSMTAVRMYKFL